MATTLLLHVFSNPRMMLPPRGPYRRVKLYFYFILNEISIPSSGLGENKCNSFNVTCKHTPTHCSTTILCSVCDNIRLFTQIPSWNMKLYWVWQQSYCLKYTNILSYGQLFPDLALIVWILIKPKWIVHLFKKKKTFQFRQKQTFHQHTA